MVIASPRLVLIVVAATLAPGVASATSAPSHAETRLDRCGLDTCVIMAGHRANPTAAVLLAGHEVAVQGERHWRVAVPLETIRAWSSPSATTITVKIAGVSGGESVALLPIGLLGHRTELAFMDVQAR